MRGWGVGAPKTSNTGSPSKGHNTLSFLVRKFSEWWKDKNVWVGTFVNYLNISLRSSGAQLRKVRIKRNKETTRHTTEEIEDKTLLRHFIIIYFIIIIIIKNLTCLRSPWLLHTKLPRVSKDRVKCTICRAALPFDADGQKRFLILTNTVELSNCCWSYSFLKGGHNSNVLLDCCDLDAIMDTLNETWILLYSRHFTSGHKMVQSSLRLRDEAWMSLLKYSWNILGWVFWNNGLTERRWAAGCPPRIWLICPNICL